MRNFMEKCSSHIIVAPISVSVDDSAVPEVTQDEVVSAP